MKKITMARISFVGQAVISKGHHAVENSDLIVTLTSLADAASKFEFEGLRQFRLVPIERGVSGEGSEIIPVDDNGYPSSLYREM